jgi:hypothetical protein
MIVTMDKRVLGFVTLLGLALASASRPALAQDQTESSWFDPGDDVAGPGPSDAPAAPANPLPNGARPQVPYPAPSQPGPPAPQQPDNVAETDPRAMSEFRPTLDPYGSWVDDEKYGTVWVPNREAVGSDFAPYVSAGHWALTDDGDWTWQSDYPFGGVVFHYGRWVWLPGTGWAWVAGRRYANAWVTWRVPVDDYDYIGWAPLPPAWGWYGGAAVSLWWYPPTAYVFCPSSYAFSYRVHSYVVRDRYVIRDVAAHTRNYSGGQVEHVAASPRVLPANSAPPRGPTLQSARIPASAAPASRVPTRFTSAGLPNNPVPASASFGSAARPRPLYSAPSASGYRTSPSAAGRYYSAPASRYSAPAERSYSAPAVRSYSAPAVRSYSAPAVRSYSAPAVRSYSAPSHYSAPAVRSAPSFHSAPSHSFHAPARR